MSGLRALLVFAKTPKPGKVKTRLLPVVSPQAAAALHAACILDTLRLARKIRGCDVLVFAAGGIGHFLELGKKQRGRARFRVFPQRGQDLGARMENAFRKYFAMGYRGVVVIGTDTPWMGDARLREAFAKLRVSDVVIGPAVDGGYYLLGLKKVAPGIFRGIPWSTRDVLEKTLAAIADAKLQVKLLGKDFDLDRPEDLQRAARRLTKKPRSAPALASTICKVRRRS